ncbi:16S rRNA (cytidine(1402)-2'-O)-methyltransferase [Fodinisporobacter ferrooxydans]|uniref:Ribosomal RNA small subunit methyltransferase I n=1 Tax=Fodinisporobacter ferrooxydans TaxID=2901836 RepID=A0ABY4CN87_9BACL|nr:16S rRNA (cytidine(1402)-2'-O)-methyltransferase [Alicyclobacillaceae bacterium MYW30-H2]
MAKSDGEDIEIVSIEEVYSYAGEDGVGILYLVATPIGNLSDITYRAVETLRSVDILAAEDTRQTQKLLNHFSIEGPKLISYHEHNKRQQGVQLVRALLDGQSVAVVTDAGTPGISDPGSDLVQLAIEEKIPVVAIPGACAAITSLIASGLNTESFTFIGFLPREKKQRFDRLEQLRTHQETLIFYESPHRIKQVLQDMESVFTNRDAVLARELTKRYEAFTRGKLSDLLDFLNRNEPRGEYVILVRGITQQELETELEDLAWWKDLNLSDHVELLIRNGRDQKEAIKEVAKLRGLSKRDVYQAVHKNT